MDPAVRGTQNPALPWTMYQFVDNVDGDGFRVSAASIIASGNTSGVNYYKLPVDANGKNLEFVAGDYDGDGVTDMGAVDRNTARWYLMSSLTGQKRAQNEARFYWGWQWPGLDRLDENFAIVVGDFDGDGKADPAIVNKLYKTWYIYSSKAVGEAALVTAKNETIWGWTHPNIQQMTHVLSGDYDGDGKSDIGAVDCSKEYREGGCRWYILSSKTGNQGVDKFPWGWLWKDMTSTHLVVEGDYDGDGKTDPTIVNNVYPDSKNGEIGNWRSYSSRSLGLDDKLYDPIDGVIFPWNLNGLDASRIPMVGDFNGDGITDRSMVSKDLLEWNANVTDNPRAYFGYSLTYFSNLPKKTNYQYLVGDYDGDGVSDCVIADPSNARVYYYTSMYKNGNFSRPIYHIDLPTQMGYLYKIGSSSMEPSVEEPKMSITPNKFARFSTRGLTLTISDMELGSDVRVFNMIGQNIIKEKADFAEKKVQLPSKGMYIVRVGSQSSVINVK